MAHTLFYNSELHILELKIDGEFSLEETRQILPEVAGLMKEHDCFRILSDLREARVKVSTLEIYYMPQNIANALESVDISVYTVKRAALVSDELIPDGKFLEDVSVNRSQKFKLFLDESEAREWLIA